jgi:hypothetical protein
MDMDTLSWLVPAAATLSAAAFPFVAERTAQRQRDREEAQRFQVRRNHKRRVFPVLHDAPPPTRRGSPEVSKQLAMDTVLFTDQSALMVCEVQLDGDCVQSVFTRALEDERGRVPKTLAELECIAHRYPHQEWLVRFIEPRQSLVYQRHGPAEWNLVQAGPGMF